MSTMELARARMSRMASTPLFKVFLPFFSPFPLPSPPYARLGFPNGVDGPIPEFYPVGTTVKFMYNFPLPVAPSCDGAQAGVVIEYGNYCHYPFPTFPLPSLFFFVLFFYFLFYLYSFILLRYAQCTVSNGQRYSAECGQGCVRGRPCEK